MSPVRLWPLLLLIAGCAQPLLVVPDADWQHVPPPQRAALDRQHEANVTAARAELRSASAGLAEAQRTPLAAASALPRPPKPDPDADAWAIANYDHAQSRADAHARVEQARTAWQRARLTWRQRQVDAATARLDVLIADRELTRARAIDHSLPGSDHYDSAPLQGQFSQAQRRWHTVATAARQARIEFERASTTLASAKEAYAQLMRNGPLQLATPLPLDSDERPRLELTGWTITRSDIGRRRGLRHLLDVAAGAPPQLRKREFRLRPVTRTPEAPRAQTLETPRAPAPDKAPVKPPASDSSPRAQRSAPSPKPWDFLEPARPAVAARTASPAVVTRAAIGARPAAVRTPEPPAAKPWDFIER